MSPVLSGFAGRAAVIAVGWLVGRSGVLGAGSGDLLSRVAYAPDRPAPRWSPATSSC